jgi:hypothetical protein
MKHVVYTSITGGKDELIDTQCTDGAEFMAFVDRPHNTTTWRQKKAYDRFKSPRRNSRAPKILAHEFIDADYSLWIDGNISLRVPIQELIDRYLQDSDIALFKHPVRDCLYDEARVCAISGLDDPETIIEQVTRYEQEGFGKHRGMGEGMFILRRHTKQVEEFNTIWFAEHCRGSVRDQISMPYAFDKAGLVPTLIDVQFTKLGKYLTRGGLIDIVDHLTPRNDENTHAL